MQTLRQSNSSSPYLAPQILEDAVQPSEVARLNGSRETPARFQHPLLSSPSSRETIADVTPAMLADAYETLVEDTRAGVSPAEMVEQKLHSLLGTRGISTELAGREPPSRGRCVRD